MKICLINNLYAPYHRGGAETVMENQAKKFLAQRHQVFVITGKPLPLPSPCQGEVPSAHEAEGYRENAEKIYRFYPLNIFSFYHLNKFPAALRAVWRVIDTFNFHSYFKIKNIFKKGKPDIVYSHNLTGLGLLTPRLIKKLNIKYIQTMHDVVAVRPSGLLIYGQEKENFLIKLWTLLNRCLYGSPDEVRFPSAWLKNFYEARGFFKNSKKEIVRNFPLPAAKDLLTDKQLKSSGKVNLLYVGQIEPHKGVLFLIKTINKLRITNYELRIIGSGSQLQKAKQLVEGDSRVHFLGWQPKEKVQEYLKQADYVIVPSLCYENSPTVIFESLSAGVPVIASDLGGIPELIENGVNGYLFRPGDSQELLSVIKNVYEKSKIAQS